MKKFSICLDGTPGELFNNLLDNLKNDYHISRREARSALFKALTAKSVTDAIEREIMVVLGIVSVKCWARGNQPGCDYYCAPADYCDAVDEEIEPEEFKRYILSKTGMLEHVLIPEEEKKSN